MADAGAQDEECARGDAVWSVAQGLAAVYGSAAEVEGGAGEAAGAGAAQEL